MKKLFILLLFISTQCAGQTFTIIDSLPDGAYGAAAWGDMDGDHQMDIAYITQAGPGAICKVYHNSNNTFTEVSQYFQGMYNAGIRWADLDNDGFDDLIMNGADSVLVNRTLIYKSNGNGTFTEVANGIFPLSAGCVDVMDFNNDGLKDVAVSGMDSFGIAHAYIFKNIGSQHFQYVNTALTGTYFGELKWGDYNNDGMPDLVICGRETGITHGTRVYKNMGNDVFQEQQFNLHGIEGAVDWVDYDHDGYQDLLVTGYDDNDSDVTILYHNNNGQSLTATQTNLPAFGEPAAVAIADFNRDGKPDICFMGGGEAFSNNGAALAYGTGSTNYTLDSIYRGHPMNNFVEAADIDNDGDYDLIFSNLVLRNNDSSTGVKNINTISVNIFPNPVSNILHIASDKALQDIALYNTAGQLVYHAIPAAQTTDIDVSKMGAGIYNVSMRQGDKLTIKKVTVLR